MKRFPNACIITVDDDMFYLKDWLRRLYEDFQEHPDDVCGHIFHKITYANNKINPYHRWIKNYKALSAEKNIIGIGCGGILYPPGIFYKDILNEDLFMSLAPYADDIWFYFMVVLNNKAIRQIQNPLTNLCFINPYREYGITEGTTLMQQNVGENKNDIQFMNVLAHYGISEQKFIDYLDGKIERLL